MVEKSQNSPFNPQKLFNGNLEYIHMHTHRHSERTLLLRAVTTSTPCLAMIPLIRLIRLIVLVEEVALVAQVHRVRVQNARLYDWRGRMQELRDNMLNE